MRITIVSIVFLAIFFPAISSSQRQKTNRPSSKEILQIVTRSNRTGGTNANAVVASVKSGGTNTNAVAATVSGPIASSGPDQTVEQTSPAGAQVTLDGTASYNPDGESFWYIWFEGTFGDENAKLLGEEIIINTTLSEGAHTISLLMVNDLDEWSLDSLNVLIVDRTPPTITLNGQDIVVVEQGSSFTDPGVTVLDIADPSPTLVINGSVNTSSTGEYPIEYIATDSKGNRASRVRLVRVVATTPPSIIVAAEPAILWPANHKYVTIPVSEIVVSASNGSGLPLPISSVRIQSVTSDELENSSGDGNTKNDIVISSDAKAVNLRAERDGGGNGRVYTIHLKVQANGTIGIASYEVWSPKSKGDKNVINDGPVYTVLANSSIAKEGFASKLMDSDQPSEFKLNNNYPNPFNPSTKIEFGIVEESFVTLTVYDMLGRTVATLMQGQLPPGMYSTTFNANGLSSGIYIYRLNAGTFVETKRMVLMK